MLEPLIVLTVLNCIFMFSSTVTTCALWWQYQGHRCCSTSRQKFSSKGSKNYILRTAKKPGKSDINNGYVDVKVLDKSATNASRENRDKRSKKRLKYLSEYKKKSEEKMLRPNEGRKLGEKTRMSEASQTINDTKSTVVMEFSTVQKVVQIIDNDSDINPTRLPFKDIVIQKDTDRKRDYNIEKNFETNVATIGDP